MYKVVTVDKYGHSIDQEEGFKTFEEAQKEADECIERWGDEYDQDFWVEEDFNLFVKPKETRIYAHPNAVDGWEDLYPLDED
jgi:hypothetical protein|tara:strand:+ start:1255 stop:1500 length:246 start_codon:yes stop_codon:yes gene_type:complete